MTRTPDVATSHEKSLPAQSRRTGRPPNYPPDEERAMMIRAAYSVVSRSSADVVTVSKVLAEAGLSTRSFYRHFASKDELLLAMFEAEAERAGRELDARMADAPDPPAAVRAWISFYVRLAFELRRHQRTIIMQKLELLGIPGYVELRARTLTEFRASLVRTLEAGAADGSFRHTRPDSDALMIQEIVNNVLLRRRDGVEHDDAESTVANIVEFLTRALGTGT